MKTLILILTFGLTSNLYAETVNLKAIAQIESSNNPKAVGDHGKALGLYQLHKEPIYDYNRRFKASISHSQALNPQIAHKVANFYINEEIPRQLKAYGLKDTIDNRVQGFNRGVKRMIKKPKVPKRTRRYIRTYKQISQYIK